MFEFLTGLMNFDNRLAQVVSKRATAEEIDEFKRGDAAELSSPIGYFNAVLDDMLRQFDRKDIYSQYLKSIKMMEDQANAFH